MECVRSSDVLDPSHTAKRSFRGEVLGYFRRMGPNAWDDYQFVRMAPSTGAAQATTEGATAAERNASDLPHLLEILPQVPLQLESRGAAVRIRSGGRVVRVRWVPEPRDLELLGSAAEPLEMRQYFVAGYLVPQATESVLGAAAAMVKKLGDR